jgi:hypothetical protein
MKDEELKFEETERSHKLGVPGTGRVQGRGNIRVQKHMYPENPRVTPLF